MRALLENDRLKALGLLLIVVVAWGSSLVVTKPIYQHTTPFHFLFFRFSMAALAVSPVIFYYWKKLEHPWHIVKHVILIDSIGTTLALGALYAALEYGSAIQTSLMATAVPVFTAVAGIFFLHEKVEKNEFVGTFLAFIGAIALVLLPLLRGTAAVNFSPIATALGFIFSIATASYYIMAKKYYHKVPKLFVTAVSFWLGAVSFYLISILVAIWQNGDVVATTVQLHRDFLTELMIPSVFLVSLYIALSNSIIGLAAYFKAQDLIEASEAVLAQYLSPLVYIPMGIFFLNESVSWIQLGFLGLILLGVGIAEWRFSDPHATTRPS